MLRVNDSNIPLFQYKNTDFNFVVNKNHEADSTFDTLLTQRWDEAQENGVFKYVLNIRGQRIIEGKYGFLAQLNPDRGEKRRKPEDITNMSQSFDPKLFNFTKISDQEILFDVGNGDGNDIVAANISPIDNYHSLLITERFTCLPQRATRHSLGKAVDLLLLSSSPYLRAIFNSLCAHASVNHLHWHLYYLNHHMPLEFIEVHHLRGPIFALTDFPAKGFCLKLSSFENLNVDSLISWTFSILNYLQMSSIAHNVYMTRAKGNFDSHDYNDIRVYIWARKSSSGVKSTCDLIPAVCELFGHLSIKSVQGYEGLTENIISEILNETTSDCFHTVRDNILAMNFNEEGFIIE